MGGSPSLQLLAFTAIVLSPALAGLNFVLITLGLTPQALCLRLLRRLKQDFRAKRVKSALPEKSV